MNNLTRYDFNDQQVRVITEDGKPWFVAKDVCAILNLTDVTQSVRRLDEDEKNTVILHDGNRGNPTTVIISESGMLTLVLSSRKPETKVFRKWLISTLKTFKSSSAFFDYTASNPAVTDNTGFVYLAMSVKGWYKIGMSKEPYKRMSSLQVGSPIEIKLVHRIFTFDCIALEKALHDYYQAYWLRGEWFELSDVMIAEFPTVANKLDMTLEQAHLNASPDE